MDNRKILWVIIYLETVSFKAISKKIQPITIIIIYYWDKITKKRLHTLEADIITIKKKHWFHDSSSKDAFVLNDVFQVTVVALVSVINHYHIHGLFLFLDTLFTHSQIWYCVFLSIEMLFKHMYLIHRYYSYKFFLCGSEWIWN